MSPSNGAGDGSRSTPAACCSGAGPHAADGRKYPYYLLADSPEGIKKEAELTGKMPPPHATDGDIRKGFVYKRVPHVTLKTIANNPDIKEGMTREQIDRAIARHADTETLFDQPYEDNKASALPARSRSKASRPHRVLATDDESAGPEAEATQRLRSADFATMILDNLRRPACRTRVKNERLKFDTLDPFAGELDPRRRALDRRRTATSESSRRLDRPRARHRRPRSR